MGPLGSPPRASRTRPLSRRPARPKMLAGRKAKTANEGKEAGSATRKRPQCSRATRALAPLPQMPGGAEEQSGSARARRPSKAHLCLLAPAPPLVPPFSFLVPCARCVGGACRTCRACCACCTDRAICLHANTLCRTRALCCASLPRVCPCLGTRAQSRECPVNAVLPVLCTRVCVSVCARRCLLSVCQHPHECVGGWVGVCVCARARVGGFVWVYSRGCLVGAGARPRGDACSLWWPLLLRRACPTLRQLELRPCVTGTS